MTKEEILNALEGLKDLTNEGGKRAIDGIKAAVQEFVVESLSPKPQETTKPHKPEPEQFRATYTEAPSKPKRPYIKRKK